MTAEVTTLSNGFRVATDHMPGLRSAALAIHVGVGARYESKQQNGIAHFLEHMAFKGTHKRSAMEIGETIEDVGGSLNAYTGRESTVYLASVLDEDVPMAVELLADILRNSVFDPAEIELERGVILSEIGEYEDSPFDMMYESLQALAYRRQQFGRPIIGNRETVSAFKQEDFFQFISRHYRPDRMILTAAGAVDHDELAKLAERYFGDMQKLAKPRKRPPRFGGGEVLVSKDIEQAHFALSFPAPSQVDDSLAPAVIYGIVMGGGTSSRLFVEARERRGLCYSISGYAMASSDAGQFIVHASTGESELMDLMHVCVDEIRRSAEGFTDKEIKRAKTQFRVGVLMGFESPSFRNERMGKMLALRGYIEALDETIARYDNVTEDKILSFAHGLTETKPAMSVYGQIEHAVPYEKLVERMRL